MDAAAVAVAEGAVAEGAIVAGAGVTGAGVWHYNGTTWSQYAAADMIYDSNGIVSFTVNSFSGYAVTGIPVPEPGTLALLSLGALWLRKTRRRRAGR